MIKLKINLILLNLSWEPSTDERIHPQVKLSKSISRTKNNSKVSELNTKADILRYIVFFIAIKLIYIVNLSGRVNIDLIPHKDNIGKQIQSIGLVVKSVGTDKKTNSELSLEKLKTIYENAKNSAEEVKVTHISLCSWTYNLCFS